MAQTVQRRRRRLGTVSAPCQACGHEDLELIESRRVLSRFDVRRLVGGAKVRRYARCPVCGNRQNPATLRNGRTGSSSPAASAGSRARHRAEGTPVLGVLGWLLVGLLALLILVELVVLTVMATLITLPLAAVPVVVVAAAAALVIRDARRHSRS